MADCVAVHSRSPSLFIVLRISWFLCFLKCSYQSANIYEVLLQIVTSNVLGRLCWMFCYIDITVSYDYKVSVLTHDGHMQASCVHHETVHEFS